MKLILGVAIILVLGLSYKTLEYKHYYEKYKHSQIMANIAFYDIAGQYLKSEDYSSQAKNKIEKYRTAVLMNVYRGIYMLYVENDDINAARKVIHNIPTNVLQQMNEAES